MALTAQQKASLAVSTLVLSALGLFWLYYGPKPVPRWQGQIEAQQYMISAKVPGRILDLYVRKGDQVKKGDLIFTIDSPELEAKLLQAKANQAAAGAQRQEVDNGARQEQIANAKDQWMTAKASAALAKKTFERINALYKDGVLPEQKRDEAATQSQASGLAEDSAYQSYRLALAGSRDGEKVAAAEKEKVAKAAVTEVEAYLADTALSSFYAGEVTQVVLNPGELAPAGFPVVTLIDMTEAWALLQVREDELAYFAQDKTFDVHIPALKKSYPFVVSHVSVLGDYATWRTTNPGQGFDLRTFSVELRPKNPIPELRAGMSVIVEAR